MPTQRSSESGFTLLELLVVVAILGIVAAIGLTALQNALDKSRQRATMSDMRTIAHAVEIYAIDLGHVPAASGSFAALMSDLVPYHTSVLPEHDHWGHTYGYESDGASAYSIVSFGKDGTDGADITPATKFEFDRDLVLSNGVFVAAVE